MDDRTTIVFADHSDFEQFGMTRRPNEHRDVGVICLEGSPVVSHCMQHVVIGDTVLAGARLDVHRFRLRTKTAVVNTY